MQVSCTSQKSDLVQHMEGGPVANMFPTFLVFQFSLDGPTSRIPSYPSLAAG